MPQSLFLGIDIGTSGVRGSVIDRNGNEIAYQATTLPAPVFSHGQHLQDAQLWLDAVSECLTALGKRVDLGQLRAISVDGTSSTVLLCLADGSPLTAAVMYNDVSATAQAERIRQVAPADCGAQGASSSLAKVMQFRDSYPQLGAKIICHQADFIAAWLSGRYGVSDENNCLKLGYDSAQQCWPDWLQQLDIPAEFLPTVTPPGTVVGQITDARANQFGIDADCNIVSGTTDSIAAFIATGADTIGDAVTSLGSTLVIKLLSDKAVFSTKHGVYSHHYYADEKLWLVGGASNCGCRVLSELFSQQQLDDMSLRLQPKKPTGLNYYPLPQNACGERFPQANPQQQPILEPRPADDVEYFQGLLESLAQIETQSYALLQQLGAGTASRILTAGGGSDNAAWNTIRQHKLGVPLTRAEHTQASYGSALLARHGYNNEHPD